MTPTEEAFERLKVAALDASAALLLRATPDLVREAELKLRTAARAYAVAERRVLQIVEAEHA